MDSNTRNGGMGELAVQQKFLSLGCIPFKSTVDGCSVDLVVEWDGKFHKIQIKTTEKVVNGVMKWDIGQHDYSNPGKKISYSKSDVDFFALYCIETNSLCLVPFEEAGSQKIWIRPDSYSGKRIKTMRFESDYKFENYVK